ncbi:MAG: diaminobutyrate acetyltransferase [Deltaproteobacteria bacterium]|nr:diaminobutyrate acetyltransferase [Deltaproteobacteria bacterium]
MHNELFSFRKPKMEDGKAIHELVRQSPPLDLNSQYCYLLLCDHFNETCIVAEHESRLAGFISAYCHPKKPDTLFVWQVVVVEDMRGRGLAGDMLHRLLSERASWASFIETTVTPSNRASIRFFQAFADHKKVPCQRYSYMTEDLFGEGSHEEELLLRIGPFRADRTE